MKKTKTIKIAIIKWTDTTQNGNDQLKADNPRLKPMHGITCGVFVKENKDGVTVALDDWGDGWFRTCETVYRRQIDYYEIREVKITGMKEKG